MSDHTRKQIYTVKGSKNKLKSIGSRGVKIAVECFNIKTKEVMYFKSLAEAGQWLQGYSDSNISFEGSISLHIRNAVPVPFQDHLWRVSTDKEKPWPDYSHLDLTHIRKSKKSIVYPIHVLNIKTGVFYTFSSHEDLVQIVPISKSLSNVYIRTQCVYKKEFRFAFTKQELITPKTRKSKTRYIYTVLDSVLKTESTHETVMSIVLSGVAKTNRIQSLFYLTKSDVIYVGEINRYRITRTPFHGKKTYGKSR